MSLCFGKIYYLWGKQKHKDMSNLQPQDAPQPIETKLEDCRLEYNIIIYDLEYDVKLTFDLDINDFGLEQAITHITFKGCFSEELCNDLIKRKITPMQVLTYIDEDDVISNWLSDTRRNREKGFFQTYYTISDNLEVTDLRQ